MVASHESLLTGELVMCEAGLLSDYVTPVLLLAIWGITRDFLMPAKRAQVNFRVAMMSVYTAADTWTGQAGSGTFGSLGGELKTHLLIGCVSLHGAGCVMDSIGVHIADVLCILRGAVLRHRLRSLPSLSACALLRLDAPGGWACGILVYSHVIQEMDSRSGGHYSFLCACS